MAGVDKCGGVRLAVCAFLVGVIVPAWTEFELPREVERFSLNGLKVYTIRAVASFPECIVDKAPLKNEDIFPVTKGGSDSSSAGFGIKYEFIDVVGRGIDSPFLGVGEKLFTNGVGRPAVFKVHNLEDICWRFYDTGSPLMPCVKGGLIPSILVLYRNSKNHCVGHDLRASRHDPSTLRAFQSLASIISRDSSATSSNGHEQSHDILEFRSPLAEALKRVAGVVIMAFAFIAVVYACGITPLIGIPLTFGSMWVTFLAADWVFG